MICSALMGNGKVGEVNENNAIMDTVYADNRRIRFDGDIRLLK